MLMIGLSGRQGSGKNTIADALDHHYGQWSGGKGYAVQQYGFADLLKEICMQLFGLTAQQCYGSEADKLTYTQVRWDDVCSVVALAGPKYRHNAVDDHAHLTAREVLQIFGTDIVRRLSPDAWVRATLAKIQRASPDIALLTDVRFPNEVEGIKAAGGKVIRLTRVPWADGHLSEMALDDYQGFDAILHNVVMTPQEQAKSAIDLVFSWL